MGGGGGGGGGVCVCFCGGKGGVVCRTRREKPSKIIERGVFSESNYD